MERAGGRRALRVPLAAAGAVALLLPFQGCRKGDGGGGQPSGAIGTLTVLAYNVLADDPSGVARYPALLRILDESDADLLALQEVTRAFEARLGREPWVRRKYGERPLDRAARSRNGQLILSRLPIESASSAPLPGRQGRDAALAVYRVNGRRLAVATTHMESALADGPVRAEQLDAIFRLLEGADDAILLGDLNFGDGEEPETSRLDPRYADCWLALRPGDPGLTWNIERSDMARAGSFPGEKSRRIDRILLRSDRWRPASIRIVGDEPLVPGDTRVFPSDHFGLEATLTWAR